MQLLVRRLFRRLPAYSTRGLCTILVMAIRSRAFFVMVPLAESLYRSTIKPRFAARLLPARSEMLTTLIAQFVREKGPWVGKPVYDPVIQGVRAHDGRSGHVFGC